MKIAVYQAQLILSHYEQALCEHGPFDIWSDDDDKCAAEAELYRQLRDYWESSTGDKWR